MSSHQEIPEDIRRQIKEFQAKRDNLSSLMGGPKQQALLKCEKHLKRISRLIGTYQSSIESGLFEENLASHKSQLKEFQQSVKKLEKSLDACRQDVGTQQDLFRHKPKNSDKIEMKNMNNRQMVINEGKRAQQESQEALIRVQKNIHQMDEIANEVMTQLDRQINKLDQIYDEMNDTQTTLKRAQKHLKYFAKQVWADRCLIFIIVLLALAIIVIIALAIAGKTPQQQNNQVG